MKNATQKRVRDSHAENILFQNFSLQQQFETAYTAEHLNNFTVDTCFNQGKAGKAGSSIHNIHQHLVLVKYFLQKRFMLISIFLLLAIPITKAQDVIDYAIHANIIYRCTKYIDWPADKKTGDFVIGIVGDSPLFNELKNFTANKTVGNQKIVIKKFSPSSASFNCHILFIDENESRNLQRIASETEGTSTLIFSESEGLARKGSCINFVIVDDHLKLEINKSNIIKRNLSIASDLLNLGIMVK